MRKLGILICSSILSCGSYDPFGGIRNANLDCSLEIFNAKKPRLTVLTIVQSRSVLLRS